MYVLTHKEKNHEIVNLIVRFGVIPCDVVVVGLAVVGLSVTPVPVHG